MSIIVRRFGHHLTSRCSFSPSYLGKLLSKSDNVWLSPIASYYDSAYVGIPKFLIIRGAFEKENLDRLGNYLKNKKKFTNNYDQFRFYSILFYMSR